MAAMWWCMGSLKQAAWVLGAGLASFLQASGYNRARLTYRAPSTLSQTNMEPSNRPFKPACLGLPFWLFKGRFKVSSGAVEPYSINYGTDFDISQIASAVKEDSSL